MAFSFVNLKLSRKRFLAKSLDKTLKVRARNTVIQKHFEHEYQRLRYLEGRHERMDKRDRQQLMRDWRNSVERKSPAAQEWLSRQKSQIWREQGREKITKRGRRPGPIVPALIYANDGTCHQLFFEKGEMRQKSMKVNDVEREEFLEILPSRLLDKTGRISTSADPEREISRLQSLSLEDNARPSSRQSMEDVPQGPFKRRILRREVTFEKEYPSKCENSYKDSENI